MPLPQDLRVSISGIRGLCPEVLTEDVAYALVRGYCSLLPDGPIALARDPRPTGEMLQKAVMQALKDEQREVHYSDFIPLPTLAIYVRTTESIAGIHITASHNPAEYNGLKFLDKEGFFLPVDLLEKLKQSTENFLDSDIGANHTHTHTYTQRSAMDGHLDLLDTYVKSGKKLRVAVDACNGAGSVIVPKLLKRMGCSVLHIATDPAQGFPRKPEPMPAHLEWTQKELEGKEYDLCVIVDPDSDRLTLIDETGALLSEEVTLPIIALGYVAEGREGAMVVNQSTSQMIEKVVEGSNVFVERSPVGELNVVTKMKELGAIFGGEGNGSVIDPSINFGRDALVGIVHVINYMRHADIPLSHIVAALPSFEMRKEKLPAQNVSNHSDFYDLVKNKYPEAAVNHDDGLRLVWEGEDRWIHLRPSNTEPIFRIIGESKTAKEIDTLISEIKNLIPS